MADGLGSDDELNVLFERVSIKLGWQSNHDANLDEVFEQLSQSTKKKKSKRNRASVKKKKSQTTSKKKTQDKHSNQSHPPPITSGQDDLSQSTSPTKADHETSRNLQLELQAESVSTSSSEVTPLYKDKNDKYNEVLGDMTHLVSPKSTKDSPSSSPPGINDYKTQLKLEGCSLHSELDSADEPLRGSGMGVQKSYKHSSDSWECENKEDVQRLDESQTSTERAMRRGERAVSRGRKLLASTEEGIRTFAGLKDEAEDDASEVPTKDFTESPQPMRWLMSPPAMRHESKLSPLHSDSQDDDSIDDSNKNADDIGDIFGENIPSLTERLTQSHRENKKSFQKNRRRSCANPRSAPVVLDNDWIDDDDDFDKEDEGKLGGEDNGDDGILDGETRLDVGKDGAEGSGASSKEEEEEDLHHDPLPQKNDGQTLNTNAESFQKARSRHKDTSSSDDDFESFLKAVKTPQRPKQQSDSDEAVYVVDDDDFIDDTPLESKSDDDDDDEIFYHKINNLDNPLTSENKAARIKRPTVGSRSGSILSQLISSDDDDDDVFVIPNKTPVVRKPSSKVTSTTSLKKTPARQRRPLQPTTLPTNRYPHTPSPTERTAPVSFLASLSTPGKGMSTRSRYVSDFKRNKDELTQKLFKLYNESIFESKLPSDFSITWNNRMRKTAGFCFYKKRLGDRTARIELSVKVCDSAERLRDTLVHELCHAAAWLIHGVSDGHGKFWKYWAAKANLAHPEIPVIKRCHTYEINTKYKYKCVECGNIIGRHSKSVDTKRFCCAYCNGRLELQPTLRKDGTPARARGPNPFAAFVKENYASVKKTHGAAKHAEVMKLLSQEFSTKTKITDT
ncbi:acidic repeat-containing protein-like isoform X2 [Lytechinus variegatus]|uniref:acidic repeat-containing protein-like isoform X2 n=1 Tax=Lytechinus variegatus TaxID=7654 RepID=UPI001BB154E6|nr:acidic repeat-containing protein-like isoform X2 [Lytechinus variegatus]